MNSFACLLPSYSLPVSFMKYPHFLAPAIHQQKTREQRLDDVELKEHNLSFTTTSLSARDTSKKKGRRKSEKGTERERDRGRMRRESEVTSCRCHLKGASKLEVHRSTPFKFRVRLSDSFSPSYPYCFLSPLVNIFWSEKVCFRKPRKNRSVFDDRDILLFQGLFHVSFLCS